MNENETNKNWKRRYINYLKNSNYKKRTLHTICSVLSLFKDKISQDHTTIYCGVKWKTIKILGNFHANEKDTTIYCGCYKFINYFLMTSQYSFEKFSNITFSMIIVNDNC